MRDDERVRIAALVCLTVIVIAATAAIAVVAVFTDRDVLNAERFTFVIAVCVAVLGGLSAGDWRRRARWRLEREEVNGGRHADNGKSDS